MKKSKKMGKYGSLSNVVLSNDESEVFFEYLQSTVGNPVLEFVKYMLGKEYLKFIDICSGTTFSIPGIRILERDIIYTKIYLYVRKNKFTLSSITRASNIYNKTELVIRSIVLKVANSLGIEDELDGEELRNFIENIKEGNKKQRKEINDGQ
jgi:hypothetical protein|nr:MAG TPA: hypothetical protein [Bacteriophage sp.]